jgi:hypothetical protein
MMGASEMSLKNPMDTSLGDLGDAFEAAHDDAVDEHAHGGADDDEHDDDRGDDRPLPPHPELPVGEGPDHADRTVGEVEDAGGGVGDHQAAGRDGVDRGQHQAEDRELDQVAHATTSSPSRPGRSRP